LSLLLHWHRLLLKLSRQECRSEGGGSAVTEAIAETGAIEVTEAVLEVAVLEVAVSAVGLPVECPVECPVADSVDLLAVVSIHLRF
jgi:hypothetical protein